MVGLGWVMVDVIATRTTDLVPLNDCKPHEPGLGCWCRPELDDDNTVSHNSMDGREAFETGARLLS